MTTPLKPPGTLRTAARPDRTPPRGSARLLRHLAAVVAVTLLVAGCTTDAPTSPSPVVSASTPAPSPSGAASGGSGNAGTEGVEQRLVDEVADLCAPGPGKTVEELEDPVIPAVSWEGVSAPEQRAGDTVVPAVEVPSVDIPATRGEAGCIVTYDAAAGCLSAVTISPAWIPGVRIDGYSIPQPDGRTDQVVGIDLNAETVEAESVEQECQVERSGSVPSVLRPSLLRPSMLRPSGLRPSGLRPTVFEDGTLVGAVSVSALPIGAVSLGAVSVGAETLPYRELTEGVDAAADEERATYSASESVLFDYNRSELLPTASAALDAILADAAAKGFDGEVLVEGHTDDTGDDAGNQRLSEERARAVADYLTAAGIQAARLSVVGRGESSPAFPNDSEANRAANRRVVLEFRSL